MLPSMPKQPNKPLPPGTVSMPSDVMHYGRAPAGMGAPGINDPRPQGEQQWTPPTGPGPFMLDGKGGRAEIQTLSGGGGSDMPMEYMRPNPGNAGGYDGSGINPGGMFGGNPGGSFGGGSPTSQPPPIRVNPSQPMTPPAGPILGPPGGPFDPNPSGPTSPTTTPVPTTPVEPPPLAPLNNYQPQQKQGNYQPPAFQGSNTFNPTNITAPSVGGVDYQPGSYNAPQIAGANYQGGNASAQGVGA